VLLGLLWIGAAGCNRSALALLDDGGAADQGLAFAPDDLAIEAVDLAESPDLVPGPCQDQVLDGRETDLDCGGPACAPCADGKACKVDRDCAARSCIRGACRATICRNGKQDGLETDIDCGGPDCACPHCAAGKRCALDRDCLTGLCEASRCVHPHALTLDLPVAAVYPTPTGPRRVAMDDWNLDGHLDLAAPSDGGPITILLGNGDGTFRPGTPFGFHAEDIGSGDFTGDGKPDVVTSAGSEVRIHPGDGKGGFGKVLITTLLGGFVFPVPVDLDGDGRLDLYASDYGGPAALSLLGDGKGGFVMHPSKKDPLEPAAHLVVGDLDCDGHQDVALANNEAMGVWLGDGTGDFATPVSVPWFAPFKEGAFSSLALYDSHHDGVLDVIDSYGSVFLGKGDGTFVDGTALQFMNMSLGRGIALADFDRDGNMDVVTGDTSEVMPNVGDLHFFPGTGPGKFGSDVVFPGGLSTETFVVGDFNHDDLPDLAFADFYGNQIVVLINRSR
jgi:hypothetical protein